MEDINGERMSKTIYINNLVAMGIVELEGDRIQETKAVVEFRDRYRPEIERKIKAGLTWLDNFHPVKEIDGPIVAASVIIQFFPDPQDPKTGPEMIGLFDEVKILASLYHAYYKEVMHA